MAYSDDKVDIVSYYDDAETLHDFSIIRLKYRDLNRSQLRGKTKFRRRAIFTRDNYTCAYCGKIDIRTNTIDHIVPRSRGGGNTYQNCIVACLKCNQKKGARTPDEAEMILLFKPESTMLGFTVSNPHMPPEWRIYL